MCEKSGEGFFFQKDGSSNKGSFILFFEVPLWNDVRDACTHLMHISFVNPYKSPKLGPKKDWIRHYKTIRHATSYSARTHMNDHDRQSDQDMFLRCMQSNHSRTITSTVKIVHTYPRCESNETPYSCARVSFLVIWVSQIFFKYLEVASSIVLRRWRKRALNFAVERERERERLLFLYFPSVIVASNPLICAFDALRIG